MRNHVKAILWKALKDMLKNKAILIQFLMFPCMTVIMEYSVQITGMPEHFFANMFASMYMGMAPLTSMAAIVAEEKEKNTLRVLQMSNVKPLEYLFSNMIYIVSLCMIGTVVIGLAGGYGGRELLNFCWFMLLGHCISTIVGASVGVVSKNQMMATSITVPLMMIFSFLPMLSMFNETIAKVSKYVFTGQLYLLINNVADPHISVEAVVILAVNMAVSLGIFAAAYRKNFCH